MPEESVREENIAMNRVRHFSNCLFFVVPLVLSISCLMASGFVMVDRGQAENAPDIVYSDIPKKEFHVESEELPCADLDEYDNFDVPILGDNKAHQNEPKFDGNQEADVLNENSDQNGDKNEEIGSNRNTDAKANSDADTKVEDDLERSKANDKERKDSDTDESDSVDVNEGSEVNPSTGIRSDKRNDYEVPQESEEDPTCDGQSFDVHDYSDQKPLKNPTHERIQKPSKLLHKVGNNGHHKVKIKLSEAPKEDVEELEKMMERIAEEGPQARKNIDRDQKELTPSKSTDIQTLNDHDDESEISKSRETRNHKIDDRDPKFRESTHRDRNQPRLSKKREPQTLDSVDHESEVARSYRPSRRKKRLRVLAKRHLRDVDEPMLPPTLSKRDAAIDIDDWGYCGDVGPEKWQEKWPDCGGNAQSPINLDTSTAKIDYEPVLKWKGYSNTPSKMTLINNGHSVVLTTSYEDCGNKPFIWDSIMNHEYVFGELTFHWGPDESSGSEHTINYMKYPLEMQVVHYRRELGSIEKAQEVPGGLAVVGILYHIDNGKRQNQGIADIQTGFSKVRDGPASTTIQPFPLSRVIPQFSKHYLSYNGSMSTPPCTETVIWLVHLKQASISKKQLGKFHRLKNEGVEIKQNNRPIQKTNKRCVLQIT